MFTVPSSDSGTKSWAISQRHGPATTRAGGPGAVSDVARHLAHFNQQQAFLNIHVSDSPSTRLASFLIAHLSPESYGSYNLESLSGHFVVHIPSRIGHNASLIEYSRSDRTDKETNRGLRQRAHELHTDLDPSSLEHFSLESLQLEWCSSNAETLARTYGVIAATNYVCILSANVILIDRLIQ
ncbi:hypothetical protein HO173_008885 [Letharia columbiana]|uniref:Uncharacterized protein n=1 Tax=Letharia columbiana TaxID=112416 RepID=A0A8H6FQM9_9LECA|nr:uncharacterized protein HO173_008885 [Letharia columbiana]KAF6232922.1 hypothetical protein HO173_008885 [Letharia columbiana]